MGIFNNILSPSNLFTPHPLPPSHPAVDIFKNPAALADMDSEMKADVASKIERLQTGLAYVLQHIGGALLGGGGGGGGKE
jgi:hypothetical protein